MSKKRCRRHQLVELEKNDVTSVDTESDDDDLVDEFDQLIEEMAEMPDLYL